jgi:RNA polymerase sigma-70 factor (ECF subfamily)
MPVRRWVLQAALPGGRSIFQDTGGPTHRKKTEPKQTRLGESQGAPLDQAIRLAQLGDSVAFEYIYRLHARRVYALCLRLVRDPVEAEDLAQEAFLLLFRKIHTFRGESAFSSWLYRLTANVVFMSFRKKKLATNSLESPTETDDEGSSTGHEIGAVDLRLSGLFDRINLQTAIEQLPEGYKAMFILHDVHGYEHNEIAKILKCSVGNSKSQLHKARKRLREELRGRDSGTD